MGTIVEFRLLDPDSRLKVLKLLQIPLKQSSTGTLLLVDRIIYSFFFLWFFNFPYFFIFLFYFSYVYIKENRYYCLICIAIATFVIGWPEWIKKYVFIIYEITFSNSCLLWQTLFKSEWCLLKSFHVCLFFQWIPLPAHTGNKWFNCCGEWFRVVTCSSNSQRFSTNGRINYTRWYITWLVWHSDNRKRKWISIIKEAKMKLSILYFDL